MTTPTLTAPPVASPAVLTPAEQAVNTAAALVDPIGLRRADGTGRTANPGGPQVLRARRALRSPHHRTGHRPARAGDGRAAQLRLRILLLRHPPAVDLPGAPATPPATVQGPHPHLHRQRPVHVRGQAHRRPRGNGQATRPAPAENYAPSSPPTPWPTCGHTLRQAYHQDLPTGLRPTLVTTYRRTTFVSRTGRGPADLRRRPGLRRRPSTRSATPAPTCWWKANPPARGSAPDRILRELGVRPATVSKYCVAVAALHPELPSNPWHQTLQRYFAAARSRRLTTTTGRGAERCIGALLADGRHGRRAGHLGRAGGLRRTAGPGASTAPATPRRAPVRRRRAHGRRRRSGHPRHGHPPRRETGRRLRPGHRRQRERGRQLVDRGRAGTGRAAWSTCSTRRPVPRGRGWSARGRSTPRARTTNGEGAADPRDRAAARRPNSASRWTPASARATRRSWSSTSSPSRARR